MLLKKVVKKIEKGMSKVLISPISNFFSFSLKKFTTPYEKVFYVASTGRSGTDSLSKLFEVIPTFYSTHEPEPAMNNLEMIAKNNGNAIPMKKLYRNSKRNMIRLGQLKHKKYYLEANHIFIKGFIEEIVEDFGDKLEVIHLYRDPVKVAKSILELNRVPGTVRGNEWYLDYRAKNNIIQIEDELDLNDDFKHDYYKCLWYWYEIEARTFFWRNKYKTIRFIDFKTENLNKYDDIVSLLNILNIPYNPEAIKAVVGVKHNQKKANKTELLSFESAKEMHENFKKMLSSKDFIDPEFDKNSMPFFRLDR